MAFKFENILGIIDDEEFNRQLRYIDTAYEREDKKQRLMIIQGLFPSFVDDPREKQKVGSN